MLRQGQEPGRSRRELLDGEETKAQLAEVMGEGAKAEAAGSGGEAQVQVAEGATDSGGRGRGYYEGGSLGGGGGSLRGGRHGSGGWEGLLSP